MGMIATEEHRPHVGEFHYRRAMELLPKPSPILFANLAWNLKSQGRMEESRALYEQSVALDPDIFRTLYGWAQMEETDRNFSRARELLDAAEKLSPNNPHLDLQRAVLYGRTKDYDKAVATLEGLESWRAGRGLGPLEWSQKGGSCSTRWAAIRKPSPPSPRASVSCARSPGRPTSRSRPKNSRSGSPSSSSRAA